MGLQAVRNGPGGPFLTGDHSAWNTGTMKEVPAKTCGGRVTHCNVVMYELWRF